MNALRTLPPDFDAWLADHPELAPEDAAAAWHQAAGADPTAAAPPPDPARIRALEATLVAASRRDARPPLRLVQRPAVWMAAAVVVFLVGLGWWFQPVTLTAPVGTTHAATLADGSRVELNSGATLRYRRTAPRQVSLRGEAFFEVARDENTPFVIETFNAEVRVLGTRFNVRAWPGDALAETIVSVESGLVEVIDRDVPARATRLEAGQTATVAPKATAPLAPHDARLDEATAWRSGGFIFYDQPLGMLFDEIERRYGVEIERAETLPLPRRSIIRHEVAGAESLVSDLCHLAGLHYRPTANGFEIYAE